MLYRTVLALLVAVTAFADAAAQKRDDRDADSYVKVEIKGKLQTGIAAAGGETTGVQVVTRDATLELDLGKDKDLREQAEKLNGKTVLVTGKLAFREGVTLRRQRVLVTVATLKAAEAARDK